MDQVSMHNSGIDIPKRKDKEDLTESSEVCDTVHRTHTEIQSKEVCVPCFCGIETFRRYEVRFKKKVDILHFCFL